jgi:hypothetical protein
MSAEPIVGQISKGKRWWELRHECQDADGTWHDRVLSWADPAMRWAECPTCGDRAGLFLPSDEMFSLDAAWAEVLALLPEGWIITKIDRIYRWDDASEDIVPGGWMVHARPERPGDESEVAIAESPAAALRALAAKLRERSA